MEEAKQEVLKFSVVESNNVKIPEYEENTNTKTYVYYGADNNFPAFINLLYKESATIRAIIDGSVNYVCGNGIDIPDEAAKWRESINRRGDTIEDLVQQTGTDFYKFRGFAIQVIYNGLGAISELYALDFARCRVSPDGKKIYYAKKWGPWTGKYDVYDAFDKSTVNPKNPTQIFYFKDGARTCYPMPFWEGAFRDGLAEIAASKYVLNNLANGLAAKTVITLPNTSGVLTEDEKKAVEKSIKQRWTGPDADSSFFLYWKNEEGEDLKVDSIQTQDESEKFSRIKASARENIFTAFRATPNLFGLQNESKGFSKEEYIECFALYQRTQIQPIQKKIERALKKVLGAEIKILPFNLDRYQQ